jgi:elongation factor G
MAGGKAGAARAVALVGPNGAGKTTLAEALLFAAGATDRQGAVQAGATVGDGSPEARARGQSTELNVMSFAFMDDRYALLDCPGSLEFAADADAVLPAADLAIVVVDADPDKAVLAQPFLKQLESLGVPRAIFVNKLDHARGTLAELLDALQAQSATPLVARQIPIWDDDKITGYVDLAMERAYVYRPNQASERIDIPKTVADDEKDARFRMLEKLADYDDAMMEQLIADSAPPTDLVFTDLVREMHEGLITPVFLGAAFFAHGVRRLLKALRHETPEPAIAAARLGASGDCAYVMKISHAGQAGKLAIARVLSGRINDGADMTGSDNNKGRIGGLFQMFGQQTKKAATAETGEVAALGKVECARIGELLSGDGAARTGQFQFHPRPPVFELAIFTQDRKDDVRLSTALAKLAEEDPALESHHDQESGQLLLRGQGDVHLRVALERLKRRFGVAVDAKPASIPYRETIRKPSTQRGRHKKQTGGHGQFGDVVLEVGPGARGGGVVFSERISGGVVPRQWIPAVEAGVRDASIKGPLGFPVVDVSVVLIDGSHHAVDSSEIAFRTAGRIGMAEALAAGEALLLEPIDKVTIFAPSAATSKITSMLSGRRGQILGFDAREGWTGWDQIDGYLPRAERADLIVELRSLTQGLGSYVAEFAHMTELSGRPAEDAVARAKALA